MSLASRFDLVIFDWAGTMVDHGCRAPVLALLDAFGRRGVKITESEARRDMGKSKADHVRALLDDPRIAAAWTAATGAAPTAADCEALIVDLGPLMRDQAAVVATLIDGARATVDARECRGAGLRPGSHFVFGRHAARPPVAVDDLQGLCGTGCLAVESCRQGR